MVTRPSAEPLGVPVDQVLVNERLGRRHFFAGKPVVVVEHDDGVDLAAVPDQRSSPPPGLFLASVFPKLYSRQ